MSHNGKLLTQIMNNLNKPKRVRTPKNQWQTPGQVTDINSQYITMQGVGFDAIGVSPDGTRQYMQDGQDYYFPTKPVREFPMMQDGGGWFSSIAADLRDLFGMEQPRKKGVVLTMPQEMEIKDPRKISRTTGKPINPNVELLSGKYPSQRIYNIVKAAKRYGVDPYDALAIDLQETGWGRISDGMVGHSMLGESQLMPSKLDDGDVDDFDMYARAIATKMQYADKLGYKDPEMRFQTYNGLGKVYPETEQDYHGFRMKKIYGVPVPKEGIDMRKNPLYGKRVMDIRDNILRKNPQLDMYVRHIKKDGGQHGGLDRWFAEKWVDVKTGKACGRQEGEKRRSYPACRPSRRVSSETPKTSSEMSPAEKAKFTRSKTSSERIPYNHQRRQFGGMSTTDSVRHQANKILQYEQLRGGPGGAPLPGYSDPKYMSMLMDNIYPEVKKILPNASAMEAAEAMDFIFNAGWDKSANKITKDPRAYALQEYYRQRVPSKLDADGKWSGRKNPAYSFDEEYNTTIGRLPENERRVLMNRARDWYYKNINNPSPGVPSSDYYDTWYGRIWNTNDFQPFNPNNPNFKPKKK